ncbi:hypothetical protein A8E40_27070 [Burkholderia cenocepacia]|nr:hypothetical protein A8E40_27070 [Burkholderia cenocepacia]
MAFAPYMATCSFGLTVSNRHGIASITHAIFQHAALWRAELKKLLFKKRQPFIEVRQLDVDADPLDSVIFR